jgi:outer membrane receptor protein involved in Fe transport
MCVTALVVSPVIPTASAEDDPVLLLPDIEVFGTTPLQGSGIPIDQVPSNVETFNRETIDQINTNSITDLLNQAVGSAAVTDAQANPYQRNLQYRGYTASPLLGEPQGIAFYQNGVRLNEPFGDVIQWDLIPEVAMRELQLVNSNPVFGLNALGGAMAMRLHDGNSFQGAEMAASYGYFDRGYVTVQGGGQQGDMSGYFAASYDGEEGWRNDSPSELMRLYGDVGIDGESAGVHFNLTFADTDLTGNGLAPVELMDLNRRANFTTPDNTMNEMVMVGTEGYVDASDTVTLQANAYFRRMDRQTLNGDEVEADDCDFITAGADAALIAQLNAGGHNPTGVANSDQLLCADVDDDGVDAFADVILDQNGHVVPGFANIAHGALNTSSTVTQGYGLGLQAIIDDDVFDFENQLIVGGAVDFGYTKFHSESGMGEILLNRSVVSGPTDAENTAVFEYHFDGAVQNAAVERGDVGPVRVVADNVYYGLFFTDTMAVTDQAAITFAGRYNVAEIELTDELDSYFPRTSTLDGKHRYTRFNPALGGTYTVPEARTTFFAGYAEANRAPSPAELTCADPAAPCRLPNSFVADPPLEQVVSRTFELGARGNLPRNLVGDLSSLDWTLSYFHARNEDDILFVSAGPGLGTGYFRNVGDTLRQGIEIGVGGSLGWGRWYMNYSYIDATFEETFLVTSENHPNAVNSQILVQPGDSIPGIPDHNFGTGIDFEVLDGWTIGPSLYARSGVYLRGDEANLLDTTNAYWVANLNTAYRFNETVEIFARFENLFNNEYETFGVLGETGNDVPIYELPGGVTDPRFLAAGQPFGAFFGVRIRLN